MICVLNNIDYKFLLMKIINEYFLYGYIFLIINGFIYRSILEIYIYLFKIFNVLFFIIM